LHSQVDRHIAAVYMIQVQVAPTSTCKMNCTTNSLGRFGSGTSRRRLVCYETHIEFSACGCRGDVSNVGFQQPKRNCKQDISRLPPTRALPSLNFGLQNL